MKKSRVRVSDHAVIRYLERALNVDVEGLRRRIGARADIAFEAGAGAVVIDGVRYIVADATLVTVQLVSKRGRARFRRRRRS